MNAVFDELIDSYIGTKVGQVEDFLSEELATHLSGNLLGLYEENQFHAAGVGNNAKLVRDKAMRSDVIYWLDQKHNDAWENAFFELVDQFVAYLNRTCYAGINGYEFHYALYEKGSFYKRHLDQFRDNRSRAYTMIMYLNPDWKEEDGGQLCIYHEDRTEIVAPLNRKCVFFKSGELEHEVLLSHRSRMSVTGWLKTF